MTTLPTGETLPEYDDPADSGLDLHRLHAWLTEHKPRSVGSWYMVDVSDVVTALQTVGDATLVHNATYRAMRRDGAEIERLAAWLSNNGMSEDVVVAQGNPVTAVINAYTAMRAAAHRFGAPDAPATSAEDDGNLLGEVRDMLTAPDAGLKLLTMALTRMVKADEVFTAAEEDEDGPDEDAVLLYRLSSAYVLTQIAKAATDMRLAEATMTPQIAVEPAPLSTVDGPGVGTGETVGKYRPQAVNGVRFRVAYPGRDMGTAVWVPVLAAYVAKPGFHEGPANGDEDCDVVLYAEGRVVSATPAAVMVVTDNGHTLALRRGVGDYTEMPDE